MPSVRVPSTRERIIIAANLLFAPGAPTFATSSSRFDIVACTARDRRGIQIKLQQWHRVGNTSLRCVVALHGPVRNSYWDALNALAEELDRMVAESAAHHQQTFTPVRDETPRPVRITRMTGTNKNSSRSSSPRTPTRTRRPESQTSSTRAAPSNLTPRATSASTATHSPRSRSSSTSSTSTIRPSTAPPGPIHPHSELETLSRMPTALLPPIPTSLTPKRSLTTRLTPFLRRQRDSRQQQQQPQMQNAQEQHHHQLHPAMEQQQHRKPSTLHRLGSLIKPSNKEHQQSSETPSTPPCYTLAPDQGPSPSPSPSPPKYRLRVGEGGEQLTTMMTGMGVSSPAPPQLPTTGRPRGPRELPQLSTGDRRTSQQRQLERLFLDRQGGPAMRLVQEESSEWRRAPSLSSTLPWRDNSRRGQQQQRQAAVVRPWTGMAPRDAEVGTAKNPARTTNTTTAESALSNGNNNTIRLQRKPVAAGNSGVFAPASSPPKETTSTVWDEITQLEEQLKMDQQQDLLRHEAEGRRRRRATYLMSDEGDEDSKGDEWEDEGDGEAWQHHLSPQLQLQHQPARRSDKQHHP
ncbi:uncharacterized protein BKCO1_1100098 [Diplodia corticola]|uniref:Uncharacterized protein n=1 Tax=Diplodia corticola TaxID=236234 RepID=A0A1J9R4T0_9PEZI|nr:uncharacterized protein BKCO1_1100098 [Diplodia corticola]OJD36470.1 hypothetical protein BKCO1_1100098 [Diplodia corticola]